MRYKYKIGADPELFLVDAKGKFRSAHNIIPGNKYNPCEVLSGAIQVDGVAAEFNVNPASTAEEFSSNIRDVLTELTERINSKKRGLQLIVKPTALFDKNYFRRLPSHAKELGCQPDFNVWSGRVNPPPATKEPFRTGAGHIHVGWTEGENPRDTAHKYDCEEMVKQLDGILYFNSLLWDDDKQRRTLYGTMGTYRAKPYGVEYRPLSNAWVADPDLHVWVFNASKHAAEILDDGAKVYEDYIVSGLIKSVLHEKDVSRVRLLEAHDYLVDTYGMPPLPEAYTRIYQ